MNQLDDRITCRSRQPEEGLVHGRERNGKPFKGVAKEPDKRRKQRV